MSDGDATPEPVNEGDLTAPPLFPELDVGDTKYVTIWDLDDTTLLDLTSAGKPVAALPVRGFVYNLIQVR
jgi:hypothetical protein